MSQIKKKFIEDNAIDGLKLQLMNGQGLRVKNSDGSDRTLFYFNNSNEWQFSIAPKLSVDPTASNDLVRKNYVDNEIADEASARAAAISSEQSAREAAVSELDGRLDVIEGGNTVAGSIAKAEKDAKDYADQKIADLINGAPGVLDTLKELSDALGGDENFAATLSNTLAGIQSDISALESASSGDLASEESARMAADDALDARLDTIEDNTGLVAGSISKALEDAKDYTDQEVLAEQSAREAAVYAEQSAREAADSDLDARLDVIEGSDSTPGSVAKALKDAKDYTDSEVSAEESARMAAVSAEESARMAADSVLQGNIDAEESARIAAVSAEESARMSAVSAEESARIAADNALDARLDVIEGDNTTAGSVAKALKDAKDYADAIDADLQGQINSLDGYTLDLRGDLDQEISDRQSAVSAEESARMAAVSAEESAREAADSVLQGNIDAEQSARIAAVSAEESARMAAVSAEESARMAAVSAEQSAREAADDLLDGRLDVLEGSDSTPGSVSKALKDAKDYTDQEVANLINGAPGVLDTLKELADALGGDENFAATLSNTLADIQSDISALESASSGDLAAEESARIAADDALDARLDVIEGDNTTAGSVAKALKDAKDYTDVETSARMAAVSAEESARMAADGVLQDNIDAEESARIAAVSAEESARMAAVSAEESARIAADNALDSRLDVIEGDNTVAGSVAKAQKDAQDYTDSEVSAEESARMAADGILQDNIDAEESARIAADNSLDARLDVIEGSNTTAGSVAKAQKDAQDYTDQEVSAEETARIAADGVLQSNIDALDSRLDVIEGSNTTAGSVAKAQKDAQDYADSLVDAEESARIAADNDLDARLDVIEGSDSTAGSVAKALKDAKAYTDSEVSSEASSRSTADAALQSAIDALEAVVHEKEKFVLTGTDISNGYIVLAHQVIEKSIMMTVDRLVAHAGDDYTVSVVGGYTRITFAGSLASGQDEELTAGDIVRVMYRYS